MYSAVLLLSVLDDGQPMVDARELHAFLKVKAKFPTWIKNKTTQSEFVAGKDFWTLSINLENGGRVIEYKITLSMAKELALMEK